MNKYNNMIINQNIIYKHLNNRLESYKYWFVEKNLNNRIIELINNKNWLN